MGQGPYAEILSPYFQHMKALLVSGIVLEDIDVTKLKLVTSKKLYLGFTSTFPPPKVTFKFDFDWTQVWIRLQDPVLDSLARDTLFMIIHNIVANKDRMNKFNLAASPNCQECGVVQDNVHLFCECVHVREAWFWVRQRLLDMLPHGGGATSNFEFIHLMFLSGMLDSEVTWMLGVYVTLVWNTFVCKKKIVNQHKIKTECQVKYESHYHSNLPILSHICGLI